MRAMTTDQFLEVVYSYPELYDVNSKDFKSVRKKDKTWDEIGKMINASGEATKKKWRNLRDSYIKYLKCISSTRQAKKDYKKWPWAMQMEKFKPYFTAPKTKSNESEDECQGVSNTELCVEPDLLNIDDDLHDGGHYAQLENSETHTTEDEAEPKFKKRKLETKAEDCKNFDKAQYKEGENKNQLDSTDYVMLGYAKTMKTFSRARQAELKLKIAQLVYQGELEQIREELSTPVSSFTVKGSTL